MESMTRTERRLIVALLEAHHTAAARKDVQALKNCFAPQGQFIGTDDSEKWSRDEYVLQLLNSKSGWDMTNCLKQRLIYAVPRSPNTAVFFEVVRHAKYGVMRGSGIVIKKRNKWRIAQYILSFSVPNHVVDGTGLLELLAMPEAPTSAEMDAMCEVPG